MKKQFSLALHFRCALFALLLLPQINCTVIGFVVGASTDARQPKQAKTIQAQEVVEIKKAARITVYYKDSTQITGQYRGAIDIKSPTGSTTKGILLMEKGGKSEEYQFKNHQIPLEQIDYIYVPERKAKGKIIGIAVGITVDFLVLLIALQDCC